MSLVFYVLWFCVSVCERVCGRCERECVGGVYESVCGCQRECVCVGARESVCVCVGVLHVCGGVRESVWGERVRVRGSVDVCDELVQEAEDFKDALDALSEAYSTPPAFNCRYTFDVRLNAADSIHFQRYIK